MSQNEMAPCTIYVGPNGASSAVARQAITALFHIVGARAEYAVIDAISDAGLGAPSAVMPSLIDTASNFQVVDEDHLAQLKIPLGDQPESVEIVASALPWTISGEVFGGDAAMPILSVSDTGSSISVFLTKNELEAFEAWCSKVPVPVASCLVEWTPRPNLLTRAWRRLTG